MKKVVCFGEMLWDVFPEHRVAGGAPMNVAIRLQSLGTDTKIISKTGNDAAGNQIIEVLKSRGVNTSLVQTDNIHNTGEVKVQIDQKGKATYDIVNPSAWDFIEISAEAEKAVKHADALVFGSLACSNATSRSTLLQMISLSKFRVFDVNLRKPFIDYKLIEKLMHQSDLLKLNDEELPLIVKVLDSEETGLEEMMLFLAQETGTSKICVTRGKDGAVYLENGEFYFHNGFTVKVEDTVGSGDSFLAAFLYKLLSGANASEALAYGCALGALVASHKGANPEIGKAEIERFMDKLSFIKYPFL